MRIFFDCFYPQLNKEINEIQDPDIIKTVCYSKGRRYKNYRMSQRSTEIKTKFKKFI